MSHKNQSMQWACQLTAEPHRALQDENVKLILELSHQRLGIITTPLNYFTFDFEADHPTLDNTFGSSIQPKELEGSNTRILREFIVPKMADGTYGIKVSVTRKSVLLKRVGQDDEELVELLELFDTNQTIATGHTTIHVANHYAEIQTSVSLQRSASMQTDDVGLWTAIRNRTAAIEFDRYHRFINNIFSGQAQFSNAANGLEISDNFRLGRALASRQDNIFSKLNIYGPYAYNLLKLATQAFLMLESGVVISDESYGRKTLLTPNVLEKERIRLGEPSVTFGELENRLKQYLAQSDQAGALPYLDRILSNLVTLDREQQKVDEVLPYFNGILLHRLTSPSLIELIWSYWHEEGMLVQTMNAIALRFQNRRNSLHDPLGELEIDPLRPLNNIIWGYIQDEPQRLTVPRRAYEYQHHYGLSLVGKAVTGMIPADVRSKFIEAFHNLLYRTAVFYREDSDTTVIADAFPLLNALKEVHLLLAEGAHNQFGDLPWTARGEMLMMQWMLARPEMREFLRGRYMVPYQEPWMGAVDSMKKLQGWTDTTITHFHELAVTGERILLSVRYGDWIDIENTQEQAKNWARYWKPEIQRYIHGYMTATGVDLMSDVTDNRDAAVRFIQPSALLQRRLEAQSAQSVASRPAARPRLSHLPSSELGGLAEYPVRASSRMLRYKNED